VFQYWLPVPRSSQSSCRAGRLAVAVIAALGAASPVHAQLADSTAPTPAVAAGAPMVVHTRDTDGKVTIQAVRLQGAFTLDGSLSESVYETVAPLTGFVQQEPLEGEPATEKTEVWLFFDDSHIYVGARLYESEPSRRVMSEMRRDAFNLYNNDHLAVLFDTFNDHRNGFGFAANRLGGMFDWTATNEQPSPNWNGLWQSNAKDFDGGWTLEIRVPFRSIRFKEGGDVWGVNFRRMVRWKNEVSYLTAVPRSWSRRGLNKLSDAAKVTGMATPGNYAAGMDAQFNVKSDVFINAYWAGTQTEGSSGSQQSYRGRFDWNADRYGINAEHLFVGDDFSPEVGFLRRSAFRRSYGQLRFSPRPTNLKGVRKLMYQLSADYITGSLSKKVETEEYQATFNVELNNGDFINTEFSQAFEALVNPFEVARGVTVPVGGYRFNQGKVSYFMGTQRRVSGGLTLGYGGFYDGTLAEVTWRGRVEFTPQFYVEPSLSRNRVLTPFGNANTDLVSTRWTYTVTPRMFVAALLQYQSRTQAMSTNIRFRWEYKLGSELFVVYSDGRDTDRPGFPSMENRSMVVKLTRLFRW
jgi:hypothetical protein